MDSRYTKLKMNGMIAGKGLMLYMALMLISQMAFAYQVTASVHKESPPDQQRLLSVHFENKLLADVLQQLARKVNVGISYKTDIVPSTRVTYEAENKSIFTILDTVLEGTGLQATLSANRKVILIKRQLTKAVVQQSTITGTVTDGSTGETLPGVNIAVKGTTTGTATDAQGQFELSVESLQDTLVFSFVGYQTRQVPINGRTEINMKMKTQAISGQEMVVVGYGTQRKEDLTGSVSSVSSEEFQSGVNASTEQLLQGKVSGAQISQTSGAPGALPRIRIRGTSSINAGNSPLYVIDGVPIDNSSAPTAAAGVTTTGLAANNPMAFLNPNDIKSIEILKDASATAIYGSRGANGVIMITTKQGKGDFNINYNAYGGIQNVANKLDLLSTKEYVSVMNGIAEAEGDPSIFDNSEIQAIGSGTDWQDEIFRPAAIQNHQLSFSQSLENTNYYVSLNLFNQKGTIIGSKMNRYSGRVNIEHHAGDKLNIGLNLTTSYSENHRAPQGPGQNENAGVVNAALVMDPTLSIFDSNGKYKRSPVVKPDNPLALAKGISTVDRTNRTLGNIYFEYDPLRNLTAKLNFGIDQRNHRSNSYNSRLTRTGEGAGGIADVINAESNNYDAEFTTHYKTSVNNIHTFSVLGGVTFEKFNNWISTSEAQGFPSDVTKTNKLGLGSRNTYDINTDNQEHVLLSYLGRFNYTLEDRYLLTATFRADGSSRFGPNNRFGYFPSFALGWRVSDESFMQDLSSISNLKIRGSWGITGNQDIGNFNYLQTYGPGGGVAFGDQPVIAVSPQRLPNPNLQWEQTTQIDIGLDFGLFESRLTGSVDWYKKNTDKMLLNLPVSITYGFNSKLSNIGGLENKGWEFEIDSRNIISSDFDWSTSTNFSLQHNEVTDLGPLPEIITGHGEHFINQYALIRPGEPLNAYYGWNVEGVFQEGDDIASSAQPNAKPGYWKFEDLNNDGIINTDDKTIIGKPQPDFIFGFTNNFDYKRFSLNVFIRGVVGNDLLNKNWVRTFSPISTRNNRLAEPLLHRWTPGNPSNKYPSGVNLGNYAGGGTLVNSQTIQDASFVRLQNVTLSYNLPLKKLFNVVDNAKIYISGQNLVIITNYIGYDPESISYGGDTDVLADFNSYPSARSFRIGINLTFQ